MTFDDEHPLADLAHDDSDLLLGGDPAAPPARVVVRARERRRRGGPLLVVLLVLALLVTGAVYGGIKLVGHIGRSSSPADYPAGSESAATVDVQVREGDSLSQIGDALQAAGVVASAGAFVAAAQGDPRATTIQAATYQLHQHMAARDALAALLDPQSRSVGRFTVPEGTSIRHIPDIIAGAKLGITTAQVQAVIRSPAALGLPAYAQGSVEGFLFPATYDVDPAHRDATSVLRAMVARFTDEAGTLDLVGHARALGYSPLQVITIASIIERESAGPQDAARVARVFYNRIKAGLPLGSEFTVHYSGDDPKSPYNTYTHTGFPPGPYNSPGEATLRAALDPTPGPWLYFVTLPKENRTEFVTTEHDFFALQARCRAEGGCK